uniref:ERAP1_C domain-containing protein n=1 Tax=Meloidogyne hapla TaxID=6305 RepID=A0A1I8BZL5_MELHA
MERTWIGRDFVTPRFPLEMWNNKEITIEQLPRTTNSAESWHNAFASIFLRHSPNPYKLVRALLDEQVRADTIATRILSGETIPLFSRVEYRLANERLLNVLRGGVRDPIEFLTACSHYIRF